MVDITTINPGTVFAWFMLGMVLRRAVLIIVFNIGIRGHPFQPGSRVPEDSPNRNKPTSTNARSSPVEYTLDMRVNKVITNQSCRPGLLPGRRLAGHQAVRQARLDF
jgi:hypothetical protein